MKKVIIALIFLVTGIHSAQTFPEFTGKSLNGEEIRFSETYKKGLTLLNFWALWCEPCRVEIKVLNKLYQKYRPKGLNVISINQDTPRSVSKVRAYSVSHNLEFPVIPDLNKEIFQQFNGQLIPLTFLIDKNGEVLYKHVGYLPGDEIELEAEIAKYLGEEG